MKQTSPGIYRIDIGKHSYFGSATNLSQRKSRHIRDLRSGKHHSPYIQNVFNKYGEEEFRFNIVLICEKSDLLFYEQAFIDKHYSNEFNMNHCRIANSQLGLKRSEETKRRMSEAARGRKNPTLARMNKDPEHRAKISAGKKGRKFTEAHKKALSDAQRKRWLLKAPVRKTPSDR